MSKKLDAFMKGRQQKFATLLKTLEGYNEKIPGTKSFVDDRFWKLDTDKTGNGRALIRFLPANESNDLVRVFSHSFQGPSGQWLIENCPTTLDKKCPICAHNGYLYKSGVESQKQLASNQRRKLQYISNILVVEDEKHPEKEGKVYLFKYGSKIYAKLDALMFPQFKNEQKVDPFCPKTGANFKLISAKVAGYPNYDQSMFMSPSPVSTDESEVERILESLYSLKEFNDPSNFKSPEELEEKLNTVLNDVPKTLKVTDKFEKPVEEEEEKPKASAKKANAKKPVSLEEDEIPSFDDSDEEDDDMIAKLSKLMEED